MSDTLVLTSARTPSELMAFYPKRAHQGLPRAYRSSLNFSVGFKIQCFLASKRLPPPYLSYPPARKYPYSFPTSENYLQFFLSYYNLFMPNFYIFGSHLGFLSSPLRLRFQNILESICTSQKAISSGCNILEGR